MISQDMFYRKEKKKKKSEKWNDINFKLFFIRKKGEKYIFFFLQKLYILNKEWNVI